MLGIHIAALIAAAIALAVLGGILVKRRVGPWLLLLSLVLLQLPMSAAAFDYVRVPIDGWVRAAVPDRETHTFLTLFYAPLLEEPAKLWPLLLPWVWRRLDRANAWSIGTALGLGFGLGEIAFLAERLASTPAVAALPWQRLSGFAAERAMVCVWHAAFTTLTVWAAARRPSLIPAALLGSAALHLVGNLPIYLAARNPLGWSAQVLEEALLVWVIVYTIAMALLLARLARRTPPHRDAREARPA